MSRPTPKGSAELLQTAVTEPGIISRAYQQFHNYSLGNQLLALGQCLDRDIAPGPINTFPGWKALGRCVRKGQKAITLCQPVQRKRKAETPDPDTGEPATEEVVWTQFIYKPRWFVLSQTEGEALPEPEIPSWDRATAQQAPDVTEIPFEHIDGNCLGFARARSIAVSSAGPSPASHPEREEGAPRT